MKTIEIETTGDVRQIRLHRPEVRHALDEVLIAELTEAFTDPGASTRIVVLSGSGPAFCSGGDARWMKRSKDFTREENEKDAAALARMLRAVDECPLPVIARVQGAAMGGGVGLVAACDIAVAEEGALFGFPEVRLGLVHEVVRAAELDAKVAAFVEQLRQGGPRALESAKRLLRALPELPREEEIDLSIRTIAELRISPEAQEGLSAFLEKRKPQWP